MTARGNVVLQTTEGTRMSTEELRFLNREQKIVVRTKLVRVERDGDVLTGYGFESDPEPQALRVQAPGAGHGAHPLRRHRSSPGRSR